MKNFLYNWWTNGFRGADPLELQEWKEQEEEEAHVQRLQSISNKTIYPYLVVQEVFNILGNYHDTEHCLNIACEFAIGPVFLAKQVRERDCRRVNHAS